MSKTFEQGRDDVAKLCHYFDTNHNAFLAPGVKEAHVRQTLIDLKKHLSENAQVLRGRAAFRRGDCEWWQFTWPLHSDLYRRMRILCPYLATTNRFAMDERGEFLSLTDTTVLSENGQPEKMEYLLGLLNSKLLTFRFRSIGKLKSAGIYEYFWNSVSKLPIRRMDFEKDSDIAIHERVVMVVGQLVDLSKRIDASHGQKRDLLERQIEQAKQELDGLVYTLYGLSEPEVALVERGAPETEGEVYQRPKG
jgi:TaqI-like C-terminal specificity domain